MTPIGPVPGGILPSTSQAGRAFPASKTGLSPARQSQSTPSALQPFFGNDYTPANRAQPATRQSMAIIIRQPNTGLNPLQYQQQAESLRLAVDKMDLEEVRRLLQSGISPNIKTPGGNAVLLRALLALPNNPSVGVPLCQLLIQRGANLFEEDERSRSPLLVAAQRFHRDEEGYFEIIKTLVSRLKRQALPKNGALPRDIKQQTLNRALSYLLRNATNKTNDSLPLLLQATDFLLANGADPNHIDPVTEMNALQLASMGVGKRRGANKGNTSPQSPEIIRLLLSKGLKADEGEPSPIAISAAQGHESTFNQLWESLPPEKTIEQIDSALFYAILNEKTSFIERILPIYKTLHADNNSNPTTSEHHNAIVASLVAQNLTCLQQLLNDEEQARPQNTDIQQTTLAESLPPNWLLRIACAGVKLESTKEGVWLPPTYNPMQDGETSHQSWPQGLEFLLDHYAARLTRSQYLSWLNQPDYEGRTPLTLATLAGDIPAIRLLLDAGADVNALNTQGTKPIEMFRQEITDPTEITAQSPISDWDPARRLLVERLLENRPSGPPVAPRTLAFGANKRPATQSPYPPEQETFRQFAKAIMENDTTQFKALTDALPAIDTLDPNQMPLKGILYTLIKVGEPTNPAKLAMVDMLLEKGVNPNQKLVNITPLVWLLAHFGQDAPTALRAVQRMVARRQKLQRALPNDPSVLSIFLSYAASGKASLENATRMLGLLLQVKEPMNKKEEQEAFAQIITGFGNTQNKHTEWPEGVAMCLNTTLKWPIPNDGLNIAYMKGHATVFKQLLNRLNGPNQNTFSARDLARLVTSSINDDKPDMLAALMQLPNMPPLTRQQAVESVIHFDMSTDMLNAALSGGPINPSLPSKLWKNQNTLHVLAGNILVIEQPWSFDETLSIEPKSEKRAKRDVMLRRLVELPNVNLDLLDGKGLTPLMIACLYGNVSAARIFLEAGANPNTLSLSGHNVLELVEANSESIPEEARFILPSLLAGYAKNQPNPRDAEGYTPPAIPLGSAIVDLPRPSPNRSINTDLNPYSDMGWM